MREKLVYIELAVLLIAVPILIWNFALKNTFSLWQEWRQASELAEQPMPVSAGRRSLPEGTVPLLSNGAVVGLLASVCAENSVEVMSYSPVVLDSGDGLELYGADLVFSGGFKSLLRVLEAAEHVGEVRLSGVAFNSFKPSRNETSVMMRLELRQIEDPKRNGK